MTARLARRHVLRALGAGGLALGCAAQKPPAPACLIPPPGAPARTYCLVDSGTVRIAGGARLQPGQAELYNVDDNSAVVLARDAGGLFAVSAICTHMCCLLTLCNDPLCQQPRTNPGDCQASSAATPSTIELALICPCHGSTFRLDGTVLAGPIVATVGATTPLPHYRLTVVGDDALVSVGEVVGVAVRA